MTSPDTPITFSLSQFIILIITIVGAALAVMGYIHRKTGKINENIMKLDKKITVLETEKKHLQEDLKDRTERLRDIEKVIIPTGMSNISEIKNAIEKDLKLSDTSNEGKK